MMLSFTEENYLKAIYHLSGEGSKGVLTNQIAGAMKTKAASVTDMVKKLSAKSVISYEKYYGVRVTKQGKNEALNVIRKHRLWETFLVKKLRFNWDEVHDVAEQLEHIHSPILIQKLDEFLGHPTTDPHGEPIPDQNGNVNVQAQQPLNGLDPGYTGEITAVKDSDSTLLKYLDKIGAVPGKKIVVISKEEYDESLEVEIEAKRILISKAVSKNILVAV
jgi:DtxR family transcriptional regulator, Mn-dependent transcriptional regulator